MSVRLVKRHSWTRVEKMLSGQYEQTPSAATRFGIYPGRCKRCSALIDITRRLGKGSLRTIAVEVEIFSTDGGKTWDEKRPPCYKPASIIRGETRDRALHSEAARDRRRP